MRRTTLAVYSILALLLLLGLNPSLLPGASAQVPQPSQDALLAGNAVEVAERLMPGFGAGGRPVAEAFGLDRIYRLRIAPGRDPVEVAAALAADPDLEYAEPDHTAGVAQATETPTPTPTATPTDTPTPTGLPLSATPTASPTPTATATAMETGTETPTPEPTPTVQSFVYLPCIMKGWPPPTATPTLTPTPTPTVQLFVYLPLSIKEWPRPTPTPTPLGDPGFAYGIQAHMPGNENGVANAIVGMGFGWVKQQVEWREVEPSKGNFSWGGLDEVVAVANAKGIRVMFSVLRSPAWASAHPDSPPLNFNDYGDFVGALAARYKGKGMAYEVWNEQNLKCEWHEYPIDACKYVELLKIGFHAHQGSRSQRGGGGRGARANRRQRSEHCR